MIPSPGKPVPGLRTITQGYWNERRIIAYIIGNGFVILCDTHKILQTIYDDSDEQLQTITFDETTAQIAVCSERTIRVYRLYGEGKDDLKHTSLIVATGDAINSERTTLSWGVAGELLAGNNKLVLYSTLDQFTTIWEQSLPNAAKIADFSYDSAYIACTGTYDRLVKIWRRLSFGSDDTRFDFSYLLHPAAVTNIHWRKPYHIDQTIDNVLYTICADNVLRVWAPLEHHGIQHLQLWGKIDLNESIQPREVTSKRPTGLRFAFMIDGREFMLATECAVQSRRCKDEADDHALLHLIEVANRNPEICIIFDNNGHMSAWGLESIGKEPRLMSNIFNIAHVDGLALELSGTDLDNLDTIQCYCYCNKSDGGLMLLVHHFDGVIEVLESNVADLFDPSPRIDRFVSTGKWTGHSSTIVKIVRDIDGRALVSRTNCNEIIVWNHIGLSKGTPILRQSLITDQDQDQIHRICVLREGDLVVLLHSSKISLWDTKDPSGVQLASCRYSIDGQALCLVLLPQKQKESRLMHVAMMTSRMKGIVWEIRLPQCDDNSNTNVYHGEHIREFCDFDLGGSDDLACVLPVDPAGSRPVISGFLDTFARDVAISYTHTGHLRSWTARIDLISNEVSWLQTCSVQTGIFEPALASSSSTRKAAIVDSSRSELTIWDVRGARLEFAQSFGTRDMIQDLDWTSTFDDQSILAVSFRFRVVLLAQLRYDYLDRGPPWATIATLSIRDYTPHPIGDSAWLGGGSLIVGAGTQLFVFDTQAELSIPVVRGLGLPMHRSGYDIFEVVTRLNGPLPIYHPQLLGQCILAGKSVLVQRIILSLYRTLKYYTNGATVESHLGLSLEDFYEVKNLLSSTAVNRIIDNFSSMSDSDVEAETVTEPIAVEMAKKLSQVILPQVSRQEQIHLIDIIEGVAVVEKQRRSMDDNAAKFMLFFRQHILHRGRSKEVSLSWREINWAYHSSSQDILADMVSRQFHGKMLWQHARESGIFMWMTDLNALKTTFEGIARNEYTKSEVKNPVECSLFYLALRKKGVLQGLWRMASWNREQSATMKLLSNDFSEKKWKTAAMKNAYALLGKHRYEYAAAFFLLADCLKDAVNVILSQLKDLQLAIAVTRVYDGDSGSVLKELLEQKVLPLASQEGNRWLASWAFWMLHHRDMAVRALISPVHTLLESPQTIDLQAKLYLSDDPGLIILYSQLRQKTLQTLRGASKITPKEEWDFVLHSAQLYDRMGCDLLALDLVRNWEFLHRPSLTTTADYERDPRSMLRRRSSLVVDDLLAQPIPTDLKTGGHKAPATVFEEPEATSLLDSFGF